LKAIIKWPGGKTRLLKHILPFVPSFENYYEPFLGSGALFFNLEPKSASLNDLSSELISFYGAVKSRDGVFLSILESAARLFDSLGADAQDDNDAGLAAAREGFYDADRNTGASFSLFDWDRYMAHYHEGASAKRTVTRLKAAFYYLAREEYNRVRMQRKDGPLADALFFIVRELCFGSMFRYNSDGVFNIPYGGFSYDRKDLLGKVALLKHAGGESFVRNARFYSSDFRQFMSGIKGDAFAFLDPPYDSCFSSYTGNEFVRRDHEDLREILKRAKFKFILIIARTDFVEVLYKDMGLKTSVVPSTYTYSMKGRNDRKVDYLLMRNF